MENFSPFEEKSEEEKRKLRELRQSTRSAAANLRDFLITEQKLLEGYLRISKLIAEKPSSQLTAQSNELRQEIIDAYWSSNAIDEQSRIIHEYALQQVLREFCNA